MTEINEKCLEIFPGWLRSLADDVRAIMDVLNNDAVDAEPRRFLTGGINYLFKSLDLIPDGIDDIGYLDDAFVLRLTARAALEGDVTAASEQAVDKIKILADDTALIDEFLGEGIFGRLDRYSRDLRNGAARGRLVDDILSEQDVYKEFKQDTDTFVAEYTTPGFSKDEKNLIKLKAFFEAKLPK